MKPIVAFQRFLHIPRIESPNQELKFFQMNLGTSEWHFHTNFDDNI